METTIKMKTIVLMMKIIKLRLRNLDYWYIWIKKIWYKITYNSWYAISPTKPNHEYLIYMYKEDLSLNNL